MVSSLPAISSLLASAAFHGQRRPGTHRGGSADRHAGGCRRYWRTGFHHPAGPADSTSLCANLPDPSCWRRNAGHPTVNKASATAAQETEIPDRHDRVDSSFPGYMELTGTSHRFAFRQRNLTKLVSELLQSYAFTKQRPFPFPQN